jgi:hypothetical protein
LFDAFFNWYNGLTDTLIGSIGLFILGALLLIKGGKKNVGRIRLISILSLVLTLMAIILNFSTVLMDSVWGTVCQIILGIVSTPMLCCQAWVISLFGWACLMAGSFFIKK